MNQYWYSESSIQVPRTNLSTMCPISLRSYADHRRRSPRRLLSRRLRFYSQHLFFASGRARKVRQQSFGCKRAESRIAFISPLIFAAQYDRKWHAHPGFVFFDFNSPVDLDPSLQHVSARRLPKPPPPLSPRAQYRSLRARRHLTWWSVLQLHLRSVCAPRGVTCGAGHRPAVHHQRSVGKIRNYCKIFAC